MKFQESVWYLFLVVALKVVIIPVIAIAANFFLVAQFKEWNFTLLQIVYFASIARLGIYIFTRTIRQDWRD